MEQNHSYPTLSKKRVLALLKKVVLFALIIAVVLIVISVVSMVYVVNWYTTSDKTDRTYDTVVDENNERLLSVLGKYSTEFVDEKEGCDTVGGRVCFSRNYVTKTYRLTFSLSSGARVVCPASTDSRTSGINFNVPNCFSEVVFPQFNEETLGKIKAALPANTTVNLVSFDKKELLGEPNLSTITADSLLLNMDELRFYYSDRTKNEVSPTELADFGEKLAVILKREFGYSNQFSIFPLHGYSYCGDNNARRGLTDGRCIRFHDTTVKSAAWGKRYSYACDEYDLYYGTKCSRENFDKWASQIK